MCVVANVRHGYSYGDRRDGVSETDAGGGKD
jgi:hypothetical protein